MWLQCGTLWTVAEQTVSHSSLQCNSDDCLSADVQRLENGICSQNPCVSQKTKFQHVWTFFFLWQKLCRAPRPAPNARWCAWWLTREEIFHQSNILPWCPFFLELFLQFSTHRNVKRTVFFETILCPKWSAIPSIAEIVAFICNLTNQCWAWPCFPHRDCFPLIDVCAGKGEGL